MGASVRETANMNELILAIMVEADYQITRKITMGGMTRDTFVFRRTGGGRGLPLLITTLEGFVTMSPPKSE